MVRELLKNGCLFGGRDRAMHWFVPRIFFRDQLDGLAFIFSTASGGT